MKSQPSIRVTPRKKLLGISMTNVGHWNTSLHSFALGCTEQSEIEWDQNEVRSSFGHAFCARLAHLCDIVIQVVYLPFALLNVAFQSIRSLIRWEDRSFEMRNAQKEVGDCAQRFLRSVVGLAIPALVQKMHVSHDVGHVHKIEGDWNDAFSKIAGENLERSREAWNFGHRIGSFKDTVPSRLAYLCHAITNLVLYPLALLRAAFSPVKLLLNCDWQSFKADWKHVMRTMGEVVTGVIGAVIAPTFAYGGHGPAIGISIWVIRRAMYIIPFSYYYFFT